MTKRGSRADRVRAASLALHERLGEERRKRPYLFVGPTDDILFIENVAQLLGCSVDYARRIPRRELPAARCGARLQYLREDVVAYVRRNRDTGKGHKVDLKALGLPALPVENAGENAGTYDPVADSRRQLGGKPQR